MAEWKDYQSRVADYFRALGLNAIVNDQLSGARGVHDVDVCVRFRQFGIDVLWLIECKFWKAPVPKEKVVALQQISQDIGADRAFLIAESGFQAGAIRAARSSNITLTSLADLTENSKEVIELAAMASLNRRFVKLDNEVSLWMTDSADMPGPRFGVDFDRVLELAGKMLSLKINWQRGFAGEFPVVTGCDGDKSIAKTREEFILQLCIILESVETELQYIEQESEQARVANQMLGIGCINKVDALLQSCRKVVLTIGADVETREAALRLAHGDMVGIRATFEEMKTTLSGMPRKWCASLRSLLIDGIYLHLLDPAITITKWDSTEHRVQNVLTSLRTSLELPLRRPRPE